MKVAELKLTNTKTKRPRTKIAGPKETWVRKRFRLGERGTRMLIQLRFCMDEEFKNGKYEASNLWENISEDLKQEDIVYPGEKCEKKWQSLLTTFRRLLSEGNGGQIKGHEWPYYETLLIYFKLNKVPVYLHPLRRHVRITKDECVVFPHGFEDYPWDGINKVTNLPVDEANKATNFPVDETSKVTDLAVGEANEVTNLVVDSTYKVTNLPVHGTGLTDLAVDGTNDVTYLVVDGANDVTELTVDELNLVMDAVMTWENEAKDFEKNDVTDLDSATNKPKHVTDLDLAMNEPGVKAADDIEDLGVDGAAEVMESAVHFENEDTGLVINGTNKVKNLGGFANEVNDSGVKKAEVVKGLEVGGTTEVMDLAARRAVLIKESLEKIVNLEKATGEDGSPSAEAETMH